MNRMRYITETFFLALFLLQLTACAATGSWLSPAQIEPGQSTEITVGGRTLDTVQSVEITPSEGISVHEIKEIEPVNEGKEKRWSVVVSADKDAKPGERSVVLVTPKGRSEPTTIRISTHTLKISDFKVISAQYSPLKVEYGFTVFDEAGDVDFNAPLSKPQERSGLFGKVKVRKFPISESLICRNSRGRNSSDDKSYYIFIANVVGDIEGSRADKVTTEDKKSSTIFMTLSIPKRGVHMETSEYYVHFMLGSLGLPYKAELLTPGECFLAVSVEDEDGNISDADTRVKFEDGNIIDMHTNVKYDEK